MIKNRLSRVFFILVSVIFGSYSARSAELSGSLSANEIREALKIIGWGTHHRSFNAHAVTNNNFGLDLGFEAPFFFTENLNDLGNGRGISPSVFPVPRFWFSWDLPEEFSFSSSYSPGNLYGGISTFGLAGQWVFYRENRVALSAQMSYTYANAFDGDMRTHSPGLLLQVSRDLEVWQPYAAVGFISANGSVAKILTDSGVDRGPYTTPATHVVAGFRLDLMAQLVFHVDLIGTRPSIGLLFSHRF